MFDWIKSGRFHKRRYRTYDEYVAHQASKLAKVDLSKYNDHFRSELISRLANLRPRLVNKTVLCLGARTGAECRAFNDLGVNAFAVGIDLNPGERNRFVLAGDFHELQFASESVDCVYTNALDHALDLGKVLNEVSRVLRNSGFFIAEIVDPKVRPPGEYESLWWSDVEDVVTAIQQVGLTLAERQPFSYPWAGLQTVFMKQTAR